MIHNGAELGGATGTMAPLIFWSRSLKKSRKVSKSKSCSLEWHQLFLPSFGANEYLVCYTNIPLKILYYSLQFSFLKEFFQSTELVFFIQIHANIKWGFNIQMKSASSTVLHNVSIFEKKYNSMKCKKCYCTIFQFLESKHCCILLTFSSPHIQFLHRFTL